MPSMRSDESTDRNKAIRKWQFSPRRRLRNLKSITQEIDYFWLVFERAGNLLAELLAEIPTALLAEISSLSSGFLRNCYQKFH